MSSNLRIINGCECGCMLYGPIAIVPIVLAGIATVLSWVVAYDCRFFESIQGKFSFTAGPWLVQQFDPTFDIPGQAGGDDTFWQNDDWYGESRYCIGWEAHRVLELSDLDAPLVYTRVITMVITLSSLCFFFPMTLFLTCVAITRTCLRLLGGVFVLYGILMMTTLTMLASKYCKDANSCELRQDGIMAIITSFVWMGAGISMFYLPEPTIPVVTLEEPQPAVAEAVADKTDVLEHTTIEKDGTTTKVTTTTVTKPDGSKIVTETRETSAAGV